MASYLVYAIALYFNSGIEVPGRPSAIIRSGKYPQVVVYLFVRRFPLRDDKHCRWTALTTISMPGFANVNPPLPVMYGMRRCIERWIVIIHPPPLTRVFIQPVDNPKKVHYFQFGLTGAQDA